MNDTPPDPIKNAAIVQLVSGGLNFFFMAAFGSMFVSTFCGIATLMCGGVGACFGFVSLLLIPVGIGEMVIGGLALAQPKQYAHLLRYGAYLELASLLAGGVVSAAAGFFVLQLISRPEAEAYLLEVR